MRVPALRGKRLLLLLLQAGGGHLVSLVRSAIGEARDGRGGPKPVTAVLADVIHRRDERWPPATMATPHPDNAHPPPWQADLFIGPDGEVEECFRSFEGLGCHEYLWDWEGKDAEETLPALLLSCNGAFFRSHPLGHSFFVTARLPNPRAEPPGKFSWVLEAIHRAAGYAREAGFPSAPVFQAILPQTGSAEDLLEVRRAWHRLVKPEPSPNGLRSLDVIPLLESVETLLECRQILERFMCLHAVAWGNSPESLRVFVARSDPALEAGLVPAWLAAKSATADIHRLQTEWGLPLYPILGVGSLPFRGGLSPLRPEGVLDEYPGIRTVTIQSAFRFGYPGEQVRHAIATINTRLRCPSGPPDLPDAATVRALVNAFRAPYQLTLSTVAQEINAVAALIPRRRTRLSPFGNRGYGRRVGATGVPRAIEFTAALYTLGVPPELIGTGRGLRRAKAMGLLDVLKTCTPSLEGQLREAGRYLCRPNLLRLAREQHGWAGVVEDVSALEEYLGGPLGPQTSEDEAHAEASKEFLAGLRAEAPALAALDAAARIRRSLG